MVVFESRSMMLIVMVVVFVMISMWCGVRCCLCVWLNCFVMMFFLFIM